MEKVPSHGWILECIDQSAELITVNNFEGNFV